MEHSEYQSGDLVIYTMPKRSRHPGPRARSIHPAPLGDDYSYVVDKFWVVVEAIDPWQVLLRTRRGKTRVVRTDDPLLRKARWWERWRYRSRFPDPNAPIPEFRPDEEDSDQEDSGQQSPVRDANSDR